MSVPFLARPVLGLALLDSVVAALLTPGSGDGLGTFLDQGRGVPWGGVLTVLGTWAHLALT